jgi:hypothetical protein
VFPLVELSGRSRIGGLMSVADPRAPKAPKALKAPRRSPRQYEEELRRQELAVSRALVQVVPTERRPKTSELAAARRALSHALHELRQLHQELTVDIKQAAGRERPATGVTGATGGGRSRQPALDQYEAARDAIDEVMERWERRRDQLSAEIDRRSPRRPPAPPRPRPRGPARGPRQR